MPTFCLRITQVMEDPFITKILWGANGDCQCLMLLGREPGNSCGLHGEGDESFKHGSI